VVVDVVPGGNVVVLGTTDVVVEVVALGDVGVVVALVEVVVMDVVVAGTVVDEVVELVVEVVVVDVVEVTDVVVDVVGYFVENTATALQCVTLTASGTGTVGAGATATVALPACTTGYAKTSGGCSLSATGGYLIEQSPSLNNCMWVNNTGGPVPAGTYQAEAVCCRLPGQ